MRCNQVKTAAGNGVTAAVRYSLKHVNISGLLLYKEERNTQNDINDKQEQTFIPVGGAVLCDRLGYKYGYADGDKFNRGKHDIHRTASKITDKDQHGSYKKCNLQTAPTAISTAAPILFFMASMIGAVFGRISDDCHQECTNKQLA